MNRPHAPRVIHATPLVAYTGASAAGAGGHHGQPPRDQPSPPCRDRDNPPARPPTARPTQGGPSPMASPTLADPTRRVATRRCRPCKPRPVRRHHRSPVGGSPARLPGTCADHGNHHHSRRDRQHRPGRDLNIAGLRPHHTRNAGRHRQPEHRTDRIAIHPRPSRRPRPRQPGRHGDFDDNATGRTPPTRQRGGHTTRIDNSAHCRTLQVGRTRCSASCLTASREAATAASQRWATTPAHHWPRRHRSAAISPR